MDLNDYIRDPKAKTVEGFITGLTILADHMKHGLKTSYFCDGEHDVIYFCVVGEALPEDSDDGQFLIRLGFHLDSESEGWAYFT